MNLLVQPSAAFSVESADTADSMVLMEVVPTEQWIVARRALLEREKAFTKARDELTQLRRGHSKADPPPNKVKPSPTSLAAAITA